MGSPDYTIENGMLVFSKEFLLRRGSCCGSGCRNCPYPGKIRVVSMVPSWTETLLACGANVVGRTRFCIHPPSSIPVVGGTKDWNFEALENPELFILDREENPREMAAALSSPVHVSHVRSIHDMPRELDAMADALATDAGVSMRLRKLASRWRRVLQTETRPAGLPGVLESFGASTQSSQVVYIIWRAPWMAVSSSTFIGSVLDKLGFKVWPAQGPPYPEIRLEDTPGDALLLFSSEPFPFAKKRDEIAALNRPAALVDGESFSWFGLRSLLFLETALGLR